MKGLRAGIGRRMCAAHSVRARQETGDWSEFVVVRRRCGGRDSYCCRHDVGHAGSVGLHQFLLLSFRHPVVVEGADDLRSDFGELFGREIELGVSLAQRQAGVHKRSAGRGRDPQRATELDTRQPRFRLRLVPRLERGVLVEYRVSDDLIAEAVDDLSAARSYRRGGIDTLSSSPVGRYRFAG